MGEIYEGYLEIEQDAAGNYKETQYNQVFLKYHQ